MEENENLELRKGHEKEREREERENRKKFYSKFCLRGYKSSGPFFYLANYKIKTSKIIKLSLTTLILYLSFESGHLICLIPNYRKKVTLKTCN